MEALFCSLRDSLDSGRSVVLATVIASSGSTPRGAGAKMLVWEDGSTSGTIGGGAVEHAAKRKALAVHKTKMPGQESFRLRPNDVADIGMVCGGDVTVYFQFFDAEDAAARKMADGIAKSMSQYDDVWLVLAIKNESVLGMGLYDFEHGMQFTDVIAEDALKPLLSRKAVLTTGPVRYYVEPLQSSGKVFVFGGGHISQELVPLLANVGFRPYVFEDREEFLLPELFRGGAKGCIKGNFQSFQEKIEVSVRDYIVILTRGHQADYDVIVQALRTQATYIGLIGSRNKMALTRKRLLEAGFLEQDLARIHNPIGLPIQAETPAEIAVSIAAEMIRHRAIKKGEQ